MQAYIAGNDLTPEQVNALAIFIQEEFAGNPLYEPVEEWAMLIRSCKGRCGKCQGMYSMWEDEIIVRI